MARFSEEWIARVKSSVDIVDVVGKRVALKQSGRNYVGLCPFHDEKTPSFSVNQEKQFFYCFGCNTGGNVLNFIMLAENLSFPEAVRFLAKEQGLPLPAGSQAQKQREEKRQLFLRINKLAARFYYRNLRSPAGQQGLGYLKTRGIDGPLARKFYLGYAPDSWDGLVRFLEGEGVALAEACEAGLVLPGKREGYLDRFRHRVMFPICDHLGRFIGFGGRSVDSQQPKYMNTPQTAVFNKSNTVYGLNWSKDAIKKRNQVVIVEGYTDYISLFARGQQNVVASLGTAFNAAQARLLSRFADHAIVAFDGDAAGEKAALRSMQLLSAHGLQVKVAVLESGQDPDGFARSCSEAELSQWLAEAVPFLEYQINRIIAQYDIKTREGKLAASNELVNILAQLDNAVQQDEYIRYCAQKLGISGPALAEDVRQKAGLGTHMVAQKRHNNRRMSITKVVLGEELVEREVLRWLLHKPGVLQDLQREGVLPSDFQRAEYRHLFSLILRSEADPQGVPIIESLFALGKPGGSWEEYFQSFLIVLRKRRLQMIEEKLSSLENNKQGFDIRMELYRLLQKYYDIFKTRPSTTHEKGGYHVE